VAFLAYLLLAQPGLRQRRDRLAGLLWPTLDQAHARSALRKTIHIVLASTEQKKVHPRQTARVYHVKLASQTLFDANAPAELNAYYTLYAFPMMGK